MILHEVGELLRAVEQEAVLLYGSLRRGLESRLGKRPRAKGTLTVRCESRPGPWV